MSRRYPTDSLTPEEAARLRTLVQIHGEKQAVSLVGLVDARAFYKAAACVQVARLTVEVIRGRLDRI